MESPQSKTEIISLIKDKVSGIHITMFITINEKGAPCVRPMANQEIDDRAVVTFMTSKDSKKIHEIKNNPQVTLSYCAGNDITFVSLTGNAAIVEDRDKIKQLWSNFHEAWFEGPDDPTITLIEVSIEKFEYWDYEGGKIGAYFDMAVAAVTGNDAKGGENETFNLSS